MLMPSARRCDGARWDDGSLRIELRRGRPSDWERFRREHYKQGPVHKGAACFVARLPDYGGEAVGFVAALQHPGKLARHYREHRVCVLEKWQGIGIGCAITGDPPAPLASSLRTPQQQCCGGVSRGQGSMLVERGGGQGRDKGHWSWGREAGGEV